MKKIIIFFAIMLNLLTSSVRAQINRLTIDSERISTVTSTEFGLVAGEYDTRIWNNPYNGVFVSYDKGKAWSPAGLEKRGITDIEYENKQLYAATYYTTDNNNGLFKTSPEGLIFDHIGPNYSASKVEVVDNNIYLGTYSHGLWISSDNGSSWRQSNQVGGVYSTILELQALNNLIIASTDYSTYISSDYGGTFSEITILAGKRITNVIIYENIVLALSSNNNGMYRSTDYGRTFSKVQNWGSYTGGDFIIFNNVIYTSKYYTPNNQYFLFLSKDSGLTWENTQEILPQNAVSITKIYSIPASFYIVCNMTGTYEYLIPQNEIEYDAFLGMPLGTLLPQNYLGRITSYFDHEYPLLGYFNYQEPQINKDTTYNFYGDKNNSSHLFYSSHNGIDFAANYSDEVLAAASGYANYYYCADCGHSIKINHQNGYETIYMHLQEKELITYNKPVWVEKGQKIGRVGLTGRTTGPHLHFQVQIDKNNDGQFNDFPDGNNDPFGWLNEYLLDPWEYYIWVDSSGQHSGSKSKYLWEYSPQRISKYIQPGDNLVTLGRKIINFNALNNKFTIILSDIGTPHVSERQPDLKFIGNNMSFSLTAIDHLEKNITNFDDEIEITLNLDNINLVNIIKNTLKLYYYDKILDLWQPTDSIFNTETSTITANIDHLSTFAVFGESTLNMPPESSLTVSGENNGFFYTQYPQINIVTEDNSAVGILATLYSIDNGLTWNEYTSSFILEKDGIINFLYKSIDNAGNIENTKNIVIIINTGKYYTDSVKIYDNIFSL